MDLPGHGLSPPGITGFEAFCFKVFFVFDAHFDAQTYCDALKKLAMKCFYMRNAANDEECGYIDTEGNVCIPFIFDMNDDFRDVLVRVLLMGNGTLSIKREKSLSAVEIVTCYLVTIHIS